MNIDEIGRIVELMTKYNLTEFCLESEDLKLRLKRGGETDPAGALPAHQFVQPTVMETPGVAECSASPADLAVVDEPDANVMTINSPIVGTFYSAPAPDVPQFVKVGDTVQEDTLVCIIEAMKVMNEVKAEQCGVIRRILLENATSVEYGQVLFELDPA